MRVLLYGFGPYRQFRDNITARIVKSLPRTSNLTTEIFAVRFQRRQFLAALDRHKPDVIIGLGQSSRETIHLETRARNRRRANKAAESKPIFRGRPKALPTTLNIRADRSVRRSNDAGDYVCNYSMYVLLDAIARQHRKVQLGFLHIPHNWDLAKAVRLIRKILRPCARRA